MVLSDSHSLHEKREERRGENLPPSGSKGLMLGDILGRNAGLTCTELLLVLFFPPRPPVRGSPRLVGPTPFGDVTAPWLGLGKVDPVAEAGALMGAIFGVLRADMVGVVSSSLASAVRNGANAGRLVEAFAGSGAVIASMVCSNCDSSRDVCSLRAEPAAFAAPLRILIKDAGVAGLLSTGSTGAECEPGTICGDLLEEADLGVAGGGINTSDKASGDTDSASELSWAKVTGSFTAC